MVKEERATAAAGPPGNTARQGAAHRPLQALRAIGPVAAWVAAVACGWKVFQQSDLLDAVLRGAAAWLGVMVLWLVGVTVCEQLIVTTDRQERTDGSRTNGE
jgi:hypothetical protein